MEPHRIPLSHGRKRPRRPGAAGLALGAALAAWCAFAPPAAAQNGTVFLSPWSIGQPPLVNFDIAIVADGAVPALACYALTVDYDHAELSLLSAQEGALFSAAPEPTFFSRETDPQGRDVLTNCLLGFGTSVQPGGTLVTLTFRGLMPGVSTVQIVDAVLRDANRAVIAGVSVVGASVTIGTTAAPSLPPLGRLQLRAQPNPTGGPVQLTLEGRTLSGVPTGDAASPTRSTRAAMVVIHDIAGRRIRTLDMPDGVVIWDGRDEAGRSASSGVYFAVASTPDGVRVMAKFIRLE